MKPLAVLVVLCAAWLVACDRVVELSPSLDAQANDAASADVFDSSIDGVGGEDGGVIGDAAIDLGDAGAPPD